MDCNAHAVNNPFMDYLDVFRKPIYSKNSRVFHGDSGEFIIMYHLVKKEIYPIN